MAQHTLQGRIGKITAPLVFVSIFATYRRQRAAPQLLRQILVDGFQGYDEAIAIMGRADAGSSKYRTHKRLGHDERRNA